VKGETSRELLKVRKVPHELKGHPPAVVEVPGEVFLPIKGSNG